MPDDRPSGPRRYVPVPGLPDLDALEDGADAPDPLSPPDPPPLDSATVAGTTADEPRTEDRGRRTTDDGPGTGDGGPETTDRVPTTGAPSDNAPEADAPAPTAGLPTPSPLLAGEGQGEGAGPDGAVTAPPAEATIASLRAASAVPLTREGDSASPLSGAMGETRGEPARPGDAPVPAPPTTPQEPGAGAAARPEAGPLVPSPVVETAKNATKDRGRELVQLVVRYGKEHVPPTAARDAAPDTGPPRMVGRVGQLIPFLQVIPWLLAVQFVASFWLMDVEMDLFGRASTLGEFLQVLAVSGLIGFGTNWLAITMLFQPREKRAIIPQGLIPAQRERVIYRLSEAISRELINADIIKQRIQESGVIGRYRDLALGVVKGVVEDVGFRSDLKRLAQDYAHEVLGSEPVRREVARLAVAKVEEQAGGGLGGVALRLYRTFAEDDFQRRVDRALDELPEAVVPLLDRIDHALDAVPAKVEARADEIEEAATTAVLSFVEGFDIRTMISERARQFDEGQLEGLLKSTSNEQLNYIKYLGAILGVVGGFVIWQPIGALVVLASVSLLLWGLDEALVRARR